MMRLIARYKQIYLLNLKKNYSLRNNNEIKIKIAEKQQSH